MTDLFEHQLSKQGTANQPLADRMRPQRLDDVLGQPDLTGPQGVLRTWLSKQRLPSLIFWGPPGCGKTTLARVIAHEVQAYFVEFSAVLAGVKELRSVIEQARDQQKFHQRATILFVDEIHRFNKAQQDAFLPHVESGLITLIGATTENPSFEITNALLSRSKVLILKALDEDNLTHVIQHALESSDLTMDEDALKSIAHTAQGDARQALNLLEAATGLLNKHDSHITHAHIKTLIESNPLMHDKQGEAHYNVVSAFIKSMRGSHADAAVYWLARMYEAGEDPRYIARRMVIFAAEDIGDADPKALPTAVAAFQAFDIVGKAEGWIPLSQCAIYLANAPKSNRCYLAYKQARQAIQESGSLPVPLHLRNGVTQLMKENNYGKGYVYPHDDPQAGNAQQYLPDDLQGKRFYDPVMGEKQNDKPNNPR